MITDPRHKESPQLRCPACLGSVIEGSDRFECASCRKVFARDGHIPDLRTNRFSYYFNPIPRNEMRQISEATSPSAWRAAVRKFIGLSPSPAWVDNIAVHGRYSWKVLMDLPSQGRVLDIGCGLGALIGNIAPHVTLSYAMDLTIERLIFADGRFRIFNSEDQIHSVAAGDGDYLPFPDDHFDSVFISGVLEWVGEGDTSSFSTGGKLTRAFRMVSSHFGESNPRKIQLKFLQEVRRILKPEGQLYIGIENRLSYTYFGQRRDHHSALWFGSLLPRFVATLYSIAIKRRPYRTYTYTLWGYKRLLRQAGFCETELFGFRHGYSNLRSITPASATVARWRREHPSSWHEGVSRHPLLVPAFGILARPRPVTESRLLNRLLTEIASRLGEELTFSNLDISQHDKALLRATAGDRKVLVKLPMSEASKRREQDNASNLRNLRKRYPNLQSVAPEPMLAGTHQEQPYFVETRAAGLPWADGPQNEDPWTIAGSILDTLNAEDTGTGPVRPLTDDEVEYLIRPGLESLNLLVDDPEDITVVENYFRYSLSGLLLPRGVMHGDLTFEHIFLVDHRPSTLISCHAARADGLPTIDALSLVVALCLRDEPDSELPSLLERIIDGDVHESDRFLNTRIYAYLQEPHARRAVVYLYWLYYISHHAPFHLQYEPGRITKLVRPIIDSMRRQAITPA